MNTFVAKLSNGARVTSVGAESLGEAIERIRHELGKNESRRWYLRKWQADGEQVEMVQHLKVRVIDHNSGEIIGDVGDEVTEEMRVRTRVLMLRWCDNCGTFVDYQVVMDVVAKSLRCECPICNSEVEEVEPALGMALCLCGHVCRAHEVTGTGDEMYQCGKCGSKFMVDFDGYHMVLA